MRGCPMKVVFLVVIMLWSLSAVAQVPPGNSVDLPAFRVVIPGQVYRGGAPTAQGIRQLAQHGIKTIVDLRLEDPMGSQNEKSLAESLGMKEFLVPINQFLTPSDQEIGYIENQLLSNPSLRPIFVHCHYGEDRTGLVMALFRVFKQNPAWMPQQAYNEWLADGFHTKLVKLSDYYFAKTGWHP